MGISYNNQEIIIKDLTTKKIISDITRLFYETPNFSVKFNGCTFKMDTFEALLSRYLNTGYNPLTEHNRIKQLMAAEEWCVEDVKFYVDAINYKTFWDITSFYNKQDINKLNKKYHFFSEKYGIKTEKKEV